MGLLDSVIGGLLGGGSGANSSPLGNILSSLITGGGQSNSTGTGGLGGGMNGGGLGGGGLGGGGLAGGLGGLVSQFEQAGLGNVVQSWIGNGQNHPVSTTDLQNVFGQEKVQDMAQQAGMPTGDFLSQLAQHLPQAVNGVTPNGRLPDEGSMAV